MRAYATTAAGTAYGEEKTFTTRDGIPTLTTADVTDITGATATCGGIITNDGGLDIISRGVCWSISPNPTLAETHSTNGSGIGNFTSFISGLSYNTTYYVRAYATNSIVTVYGNQFSFTTLDDNHAYVDLGLPSGLLWATCNVGATAPEDYGNYFAWGEILPKDFYDWSTYQYICSLEDYPYYEDEGDEPHAGLTKYCYYYQDGCGWYSDTLTTLLPEDDAATANWGNGWRMPTHSEWQELKNNTTVTWTMQNGVYGRLFTASNGNSLFMPAAGCRHGSGFNNVGSRGYYWSSSLFTENSYIARYFGVGASYYFSSTNYRDYGQSVRPVRSSGQN